MDDHVSWGSCLKNAKLYCLTILLSRDLGALWLNGDASWYGMRQSCIVKELRRACR